MWPQYRAFLELHHSPESPRLRRAASIVPVPTLPPMAGEYSPHHPYAARVANAMIVVRDTSMKVLFALIDCNNFYVSCERLFQPALLGKPVVVLSNFSPGHFCKSFCNTHLRGCPIVYSRWRAQPIQQAQAMRDNLRRYRAIREAWTP